jgi:ATP-binding protein involved in chromosome partitioning
VQSIREGSDEGLPSAADTGSVVGLAFAALADKVVSEINFRNTHLKPTEKVHITKK